MVRKIIQIDKEKCNGCMACVTACHEDAIGIIDGVATLLRDDYCDGLGDCLPTCPTNAIKFITREATEYDDVAVKKNQKLKALNQSNVAQIVSPKILQDTTNFLKSKLSMWPVQIKLVNENADFFHNADLLISADCCAYAYADFHNKFMQNRVVLVGCPKLDEVDYSEKLHKIIKNNNIKTITLVRMEVPCCGGIEFATKKALEKSMKIIPLNVVTLSLDGKILSSI